MSGLVSSTNSSHSSNLTNSTHSSNLTSSSTPLQQAQPVPSQSQNSVTQQNHVAASQASAAVQPPTQSALTNNAQLQPTVQLGNSTAIQSRSGATTATPKGWISWLLSTWLLSTLISISIIMQIIGVWLTIWSNRDGGLRTITSRPQDTYSFELGTALLWTALPAVVFQIHGLTFGASVMAACKRQPFVELLRDGAKGADPEKSILLDYSHWISPWIMVKTLQYGHIHLTFAVVVGWMALLLGPLGSHFFDTATFVQSNAVVLSQTNTFNDTAFGARSDMGYVLDLTIATQVYKAPQSPWITANTSLLPFAYNESRTVGLVHNVTFDTPYYSFVPDCQVLQPQDRPLVYTSNPEGWYLTVQDRGCTFGGIGKALFTTQLTGSSVYFIDTYTASCSASANSSRIIVVAALNSKGSTTTFDQVVAVSCIPYYRMGNGSVSLTYSGTDNPVRTSFAQSNASKDATPVFARNFENQITQPTFSDVTREELATRLGHAILGYARNQNASNFMEDSTMLNATVTILQSAFNLMVQTYLVQQASQSVQITGTAEYGVERLFVVWPVSCTTLGVLLFVWIAALGLHVYTHKTRQAQYEEGPGMLGPAVICNNVDLLAQIQEEKSKTHDGKVYSQLAKDMKRLPRKGFKIVNWHDPTKARLEITAESRPVRWFRS